MNCPHAPYCQHKRWTAPDDLTRTTGTWYSRLAYNVGRRRRRMEQVAQAGQWAAPAVTQAPVTSALNPGETVWRTLDSNADIRVQARMGWQVASYVVVFGGCCVVGWYWPDSIPAAVFIGFADIVAAAVFLRLNWDILVLGDDGRLVTRKREADATPTPSPQVVQVDLNADLDKGHGNTQKTRVRLPLSQVRAWRKFCQDVTAGDCKFSGNAAVAHGLDRTWFNGLIARWAGLDPKRALIDTSSVGPRKTLKLTPAGEDRIELDAHAPLPHLMSLLEAMTGTDR